MSWLRIDDHFTTHPKILELTRDQRWTWMEVLTYTCRYRTPVVPTNIQEVVKKASISFVKTCVNAGLLDVDEHGVARVHDWHEYQAGDPKKALRQAKWREKVDGQVDAPVDGGVDAPVDADVAASRAGDPYPSRTSTHKDIDPLGVEEGTNGAASDIEHPNDHAEDPEAPFDIEAMTERVVDSFGEL